MALDQNFGHLTGFFGTRPWNFGTRLGNSRTNQKNPRRKVDVENSFANLTKNKLHLTGGWAATGFIEAMRRGVHGFIPSTMETIYNSVYNLMINNEEKEARKLFYRILPAISFAHQHIDISIKFYKMLRVAEEIFSTDVCRGDIQEFDEAQRYEAEFHIDNILNLQKELLNKNNK